MMMRGGIKRGFTLIELTLSMVFIGILSIAIVLITSNTVSSYRRGILLSQLNSVGMSLVEDMRVTARASTNGLDQAKGFGKVNDVGDDVPIYGALCTKDYSYVWNSGYLLDSDRGKGVPDSLTWDGEKFALLKLKNRANSGESIGDSDACDVIRNIDGSSMELDDGSNGFGLEAILIAYDEGFSNGLALYDLALGLDAKVGPDVFYIVEFKLGTVDGDANILAKENQCKAPVESGRVDFDYCAINQFSFAVQAREA